MCLADSDRLMKTIRETQVTMVEWKKQRDIYRSDTIADASQMAFAALFLNRCNRSGIISGGPIGGADQAGEWRLDVRFTKETLCQRIQAIADCGERISFEHEDALVLLKQIDREKKADDEYFVYLDPPYFKKADRLYLNHYSLDDHAELATYITNDATFPWLLTYDDHPQIRRLYCTQRMFELTLNYSAQKKRKGTELLILSKELLMPSSIIEKYKLKPVFP